jgi:phosphatidylinositol kinase/protein kinase (PI-3  family)
MQYPLRTAFLCLCAADCERTEEGARWSCHCSLSLEYLLFHGLLSRLRCRGSTWRLADTGITGPKVIIVEGSDGRMYRQVIKMAQASLDDTRQDAIMEQLFGLVNRFLAAAAPTRQRRLRVRTYKVRLLVVI